MKSPLRGIALSVWHSPAPFIDKDLPLFAILENVAPSESVASALLNEKSYALLPSGSSNGK
nr:MAG: hypothetical protein [Bacteriophage sp.]